MKKKGITNFLMLFAVYITYSYQLTVGLMDKNLHEHMNFAVFMVWALIFAWVIAGISIAVNILYYWLFTNKILKLDLQKGDIVQLSLTELCIFRVLNVIMSMLLYRILPIKILDMGIIEQIIAFVAVCKLMIKKYNIRKEMIMKNKVAVVLMCVVKLFI